MVAGSATVPPGSKGAVTVIFQGGMIGMKNATLKIFSNDPIKPEQTVPLRFEVVR